MADAGSEPSSSDEEYLPSSTEEYDDSESSEADGHGEARWERLFFPSTGPSGEEDTFSLASLLRSWETGIPTDLDPLECPENQIALPRLDADQLRTNGFLRADVDSIKGLVGMKDIARVFHPDPLSTNRLANPEIPAYVKISLQTCLPKSADHLRGTGFKSGKGGKKPSSVLSIPKVPKPSLLWAEHEESNFPWPFPEPSVNLALEWISLAELPHFLLGQAHGGRTEDISLWCICPSAFCLSQPVWKCKAVAQRALHKSKGMAMDALEGMIEIWRRVLQMRRGEMHALTLLTPTQKLVFDALESWMVFGVSRTAHFESVYNDLLRWNIYETPPQQVQSSEQFFTRPEILHLVTHLFVHVVENNLLNLPRPDKDLLRHSLVYLDAKGLKEKITAVNLTAVLEPNFAPLQETLDLLVPSLKQVTRGLCRIDVGQEWTIRPQGQNHALLWSMGNHTELMSLMPRRWKTNTRLYSSLGLAQAVNLQTHILYWIPPHPQNPDELDCLPLPSDITLPHRNGPTYMDIRVPHSEIPQFEGEIPAVASVFEGVSVLNMYCPGPRKIASSYGREWALEFDGTTPLLALLAAIGEAAGVRTEMVQDFTSIQTMVVGFVSHLEAELPAQRAWSLRAEVGARSLDEAVYFLQWYSRLNKMDIGSLNVENNQLHAVSIHKRPLCIPMDQLTRYLRSMIGDWVEKLRLASMSIPMGTKEALLGACAEQALKDLTFLFRGRNTWPPALSKMFVHDALLGYGVLLPRIVEGILNSVTSHTRSNWLEAVHKSYMHRSWRSKRKERLASMSRTLQSASILKNLLEGRNTDGPMTLRQRDREISLHLIKTFYRDLWGYLAAKGHWQKDAPQPTVLTRDHHCYFDPSTMHTRLRDPAYNARQNAPSLVYPSTGLGRRSITSWEFVNRWFPLSPVNRAGMVRGNTNSKGSRFYCTFLVWDFIQSGLPEERLKTCRKMLEDMASSTSWYATGNTGTSTRRPSGILVPDGPNQTRPYRTINHWIEVVGRQDDPFVPPTPRAHVQEHLVEVTRSVLKKEYEFFRQGSSRRFTEHELDVFSMYILLEGGAEKLHSLGQPRESRSAMTHLQAFVDPEKAPLYCFRLRRTVQQVTDKYNAACKANKTQDREWSLHGVLIRIEACLGDDFLGPDGRINQEQAYEWLVRNRQRTLRDFRRSFPGRCGPVVTPSIRASWECHVAIAWDHPIHPSLLPLGYSTQHPGEDIPTQSERASGRSATTQTSELTRRPHSTGHHDQDIPPRINTSSARTSTVLNSNGIPVPVIDLVDDDDDDDQNGRREYPRTDPSHAQGSFFDHESGFQ